SNAGRSRPCLLSTARKRFPLLILALVGPFELSLPLPSGLQDSSPPFVGRERRRADRLAGDLDLLVGAGKPPGQRQVQDAVAADPGLDHDAIHEAASSPMARGDALSLYRRTGRSRLRNRTPCLILRHGLDVPQYPQMDLMDDVVRPKPPVR